MAGASGKPHHVPRRLGGSMSMPVERVQRSGRGDAHRERCLSAGGEVLVAGGSQQAQAVVDDGLGALGHGRGAGVPGAQPTIGGDHRGTGVGAPQVEGQDRTPEGRPGGRWWHAVCRGPRVGLPGGA